MFAMLVGYEVKLLLENVIIFVERLLLEKPFVRIVEYLFIVERCENIGLSTTVPYSSSLYWLII